jgi:hypothetical protein
VPLFDTVISHKPDLRLGMSEVAAAAMLAEHKTANAAT